MAGRRCAHCGRRTRASLPPGRAPPAVRGAAHRGGGPPERPLSVEPPGSAAVAAGPVGGPGVAGRGGAPGAGPKCRSGPVVEEAQAAIRQSTVVNMDEAGWRQEQRRAWLWTMVTAELTVFHIDRNRGGAVVDALLGV